MPRRYHILDVFTDTKLAGNPLAVVLDSEGLDPVGMQRIAREFNLAETVFVAEPRDPIHFAAVRIFTPAVEMPFAGHPTIGTAILLATLRAPDLLAREDLALVLEESIGPVTCSIRQRRGQAAHASFEVPKLAELLDGEPDPRALAELLGLDVGEIGFAAHRPMRCSAGNPAIFVPLASLDVLARARLGTSDGEKVIYYLYTPGGEGPGPRSFRARMFAPAYGFAEDPATGSVAAALPAILLAAERLADGDHDCIVHQGVEMGRPSKIGVAFRAEGGRLVSTAIGGSAVLVAEGTLDV